MTAKMKTDKGILVYAMAVALMAISVVMLAGIFASQAMAADNVSATPHNVTTIVGITDYGQICVYCHTPHNGSTTARPLWNRNTPAGPFTMYDSTWSSTINMTIDPAPTGVSLACLSCHDGSIGLDVIINRPGGKGAVFAAPSGTLMPDTGVSDYNPRLGTDLRNDHPISVTYDIVADPAFKTAADVATGGLKLFEGKVQCASCHNPHSEDFPPFLRKSNAASALCLTCHIK